MINGAWRSKAIKAMGTVAVLLCTSIGVGVKGASSQTVQPALNCYRLSYQAAFQSPDGRHRLSVVDEASSLASSRLVYRDRALGGSPLDASALDSPGAAGVLSLQSIGLGRSLTKKFTTQYLVKV
jgi:hypothetical protein